METRRDGEFIMVKLLLGEDLFGSLEKACREHDLRSAAAAAGIGVLQDFELGYYHLEKKQYSRQAFHQDHELLSLQGSVAMMADPTVHLHTSVAGPDLQVKGGHLFRATIGASAEVYLLGLPRTTLDRVPNPLTGLREMAFRK